MARDSSPDAASIAPLSIGEDDSERRVVAAATMYYLQELKMDVIARRLHTSRSTVSRMLKTARERGLVEITVRPTPTQSAGIAREIKDRYDVRVYVATVPEDAREADRLDQVSKATARVLTNWFDSDMILGVAWGTTTTAIANHLNHKPTLGSTIVQLNGAANTRTSGAGYVGSLLGRFGEAFDASVQYFPVPAFFDRASTRTAMWEERSIRRVIDMQRSADVALFSTGAVAGNVPSHVYSAGYLDADEMVMLLDEGVVGDVCTVFLRADGTYDDLALNQRATGPTPAELRGIPRRLCAVAGSAKATPLHAALVAGAVTHLVTDDITARQLLELAA
jgi:DNA-binding transcriptional regulator LsrR (DeoR family)